MHVRYYKDMGLTVAISVTDNYITYGVARCSKSDQFNKRVGRELATSRCLTTPSTLSQAQINDLVILAILESRQPFAFKLGPFACMLKYFTLNDYNTEVLFAAAAHDYATNSPK